MGEKNKAMGPLLMGLNLTTCIEDLRREPAYQRGRSSTTLVKYPEFHVALIAMRAGAIMPEHAVPGSISIQVVKGHIGVHALEQLTDLPEGDFFVLAGGIPHDVVAVDDSAFLLTIAQRGT